jgi:hypothetical protein
MSLLVELLKCGTMNQEHFSIGYRNEDSLVFLFPEHVSLDETGDLFAGWRSLPRQWPSFAV